MAFPDYNVYEAPGDLAEPTFPGESFADLLRSYIDCQLRNGVPIILYQELWERARADATDLVERSRSSPIDQARTLQKLRQQASYKRWLGLPRAVSAAEHTKRLELAVRYRPK